MSHKNLYSSRPIRVRVAVYVLIILAAVVSVSPAFTRLTVLAQGDGAAADKPGDAQPRAEFIRQLPLTANDIIYNPADGMLYASVPSRVGASGNSILPINPATGEMGTPVFVGSEPNKLAISDDGHTLYVSLDGASAIRRFDTATRTAGQQFSVPPDDFYGNYHVSDLAVAPGNPNVVAVARERPTVSPRGGGVAVFENGVQRPKTSPEHSSGSEYLAFSATGSELYGVSNYGNLLRMTIDASGVTVKDSASFSVNGRIKFANGRIYSSGAQVINADTNTLLGTFPTTSSNAFAIDAAAGRAYYLRYESSSSNTLMLQAFDLNTFVLVGSATLEGFRVPSSMTRWGANGLALHTYEHVYLIQTSLIPSSAPIPTPTPSVSPTPTPTPAEIPAIINKVDLPAKDLVINAVTQTLYASVPSAAGGTTGNTITSIDPKTGVIGSSTFIGSEPGKLAISDDGQVLYTYLEGAKAIRRFDIATKTPGVQFTISADKVLDMEVLPGSQQSLAVVRSGGSGDGSVAVYDNGVQRPNTSSGGRSFRGPITFGATPSTLYGYNDSGNSELVKFEVNASGVQHTSVMRQGLFGLYDGFRFADGRLYSASGHVLDPEANTAVGRFNVRDSNLLIDPTLGRAFFISIGARNQSASAVLTAYDLNTFRPLGSITLPGAYGIPAGLVRWGADGLAFCMLSDSFYSSGEPSRIYLIQSELISGGKPLQSTLQFSAPNYSISESASLKTLVTVTRAGDVTGAATVSYATGGGTATPGSDYTPVSGTLSFAEGETTKTFTVSLIDDSVYEGTSETIGLTLSEPNGNVTLGSQKTATLTIQDSKSRPSIMSVSMAVPEGDSGTTNTQFVVGLSHASTETISVNYATADDTANGNSDYVAASGTLTFQPGELEKTITLQIKGDTADEGDERFSLNFSNPVNAKLNTGNYVVTIVGDDRPFIEFGASTFTASEGEGRATITIRRLGTTIAQVGISYFTLDDTRAIRCDDNSGSGGAAFARCDYATTYDTLVFAPGEREKTFTIPLVDDGHVEQSEVVNLRLTSPVGVPLGARFSAVLHIEDNDTANTPNPVGDHAFFVRQHYLDFLSREPDTDGLAAWTRVLAGCANAFNTEANSPAALCDRNIVSSSFFRSAEFELKGYFVYRFYRVAFNRRPSYAEFVTDMRRITGQTAEEVYSKRRAFSDAWVQRNEFHSYLNWLGHAGLVDMILKRYGVTAITTNDPANFDGDVLVRLTRDELVAALNAQPQRLTLAQVLRAIVQSREVDAVEYNGAFVAMQYYGYLRREPEQAGYDAWLQVITRGDGYRVMVNGFMNSTEYRLRFGK